MPIRAHRIPNAPNPDRVALAAGHKGLTIEWVEHSTDDRSEIERISGQPYVPVVEFEDGAVVYDSPRVLEELERRFPEPSLYPASQPDRARAEVFVEWFNGVWKAPMNRLADGEALPGDAEWLRASSDRIDGLLAGSDYLIGDAPTIADFTAFPFMNFARDIPYTNIYAQVMREHLSVEGRLRLAAWLERCDALPRG